MEGFDARLEERSSRMVPRGHRRSYAVRSRLPGEGVRACRVREGHGHLPRPTTHVKVARGIGAIPPMPKPPLNEAAVIKMGDGPEHSARAAPHTQGKRK